MWHKDFKRHYPWRSSRTPYRVLVAEIMLQRTRADQVAVIYPTFIQEFPDPKSVIQTSISHIKRHLAPLGLKHRAPRFMRLMKQLAEDFGGKIPDTMEELLTLVGIGRYIAAAILCFGFRKDIPIVDANVIRVYGRFFGLKSSSKRPHTDRKIWEFAAGIIPASKGPEFNEALLDFAAIICKSKPLHEKCPVSSFCEYYQTQTASAKI